MARHIESSIQIALVEYIERYLHQRVYAIPNGFYVPNANPQAVKRVVERMKREGLRKGVPDLCVPCPQGQYHGLYIELKTSTGEASTEQKQWIRYLQSVGYKAEIVYGFDEALKLVNSYFGVKTK